MRDAMVGALVVVTVGACGSVNGSTKDASGGSGDAGGDAGIDGPPVACTMTTCTNSTLQVCGSNGVVTSTQSCELGCYTDQTRCNGIVPSNATASNVDQAAQQTDVTLPDGTTINTDNGTVTGPSGAITIATTTIAQPSGPTLRVLMAKSFSIGDVRVTGTAALAIVAAGDITLTGVLDLSADAATPGPGALACAGTGAGVIATSGFFQRAPAGNSGGYPTYIWTVGGGGGGGFGSTGGAGGNGSTVSTGGAGGGVNGVATLVPLRGGCPGASGNGTYVGGGGGAVQLVTNTTVHLVDGGAKKGWIHVGGGGGHPGDLGRAATTDTNPVDESGGGGAGGGILIEAGKVVLDSGTGLTATGAGGAGWGACSPAANGTDATASASTPLGGACAAGTTPAQVGGDGATTGAGGGGQASTVGSGGGGGGGLGRIRLNTADAQYSSQSSTVVLGVVTTGTAQTR